MISLFLEESFADAQNINKTLKALTVSSATMKLWAILSARLKQVCNIHFNPRWRKHATLVLIRKALWVGAHVLERFCADVDDVRIAVEEALKSSGLVTTDSLREASSVVTENRLQQAFRESKNESVCMCFLAALNLSCRSGAEMPTSIHIVKIVASFLIASSSRVH